MKKYIGLFEIGSIIWGPGMLMCANALNQWWVLWFVVPMFIFAAVIFWHYNSVKEEEAWRMKAPDSEGEWLRINAFNQPELYSIRKNDTGNLTILDIEKGCQDIKDNKSHFDKSYWRKITNIPRHEA